MDRLLPALIIVAVVAIVFALLARGWRARSRSQAELGAPEAPPTEPGEVALSQDLLYVATTRADSPLDRIAVAGLRFRARAVVTVTASGVVLDLAGVRPAFIPRAAITGVGRATWTIDRVVGTDGLVFVRWRLGGAEVDSYLRSADPDALVTALTPLAPAPQKPAKAPSTPRSTP
ncbi:MAG: hypothetical protein KF727_03690 [Microbacteriaceae bacterium]|nr:hypothetical protein [Microbacteriaceae bacterium]